MKRLALMLVLLAGCASQKAQTPSAEQPTAAPNQELRDPEQVSRALDQAQRAYLAGEWGQAVVAATQVIEGGATPQEYYVAVKILALASCNRKDAGPVQFAYKRLSPDDQASVRNECAQNGLVISDTGSITPK